MITFKLVKLVLYIQATVAAFDIKTSGGEDGISINNNSTLELYYNGIKSFQTAPAGIDVFDTSGNNPILNLRHSNGDIAGNISFSSEIFNINDWANSNTIMQSIGAGTVRLFYDGVKTVETNVNGGLTTYSPDQTKTGYLITGDNGTTTLRSLNSGALQLYENNNQAVYCNVSGSVDLFYNGAKSAFTTADGLAVRDTNSTGPQVDFYDNGNNHLGRLQTTVTLMNFFIGSALETGMTIAKNGAVSLYHDDIKVSETTANGITGAVWG